MNNKRRNRKSNRGVRDNLVTRLFAQTKLPAHVTEEQDWYLDTPDVRLTRVFTIVLILHVVAVGGILAFKMIEKASTPGSVATVATPAATEAARVVEPAAAPRTSTAPANATRTEVATGSRQPAAPAVVSNDATPGVIEYRITTGDTLVEISRKMGVSVAAIKAENSIDTNNVEGSLYEGRWLKVTRKDGDKADAPAGPPSTAVEVAAKTERPKAATERVSNPAPSEAPAAKRPATAPAEKSAQSKTYVVQKGDTAYGIARKFGIKHTALMATNGIDRPELLQLGQTLKIPTN